MVDTDMSPADNGGACGGCKGVVGGQQRTRAVERFEDLVFGENSCCWEISCIGGFQAIMCRGWPTGLQWWSYDLALNASPVIPFSVILRDPAPLWGCSGACFAQLAMGSSNPPFSWDSYSFLRLRTCPIYTQSCVYRKNLSSTTCSAILSYLPIPSNSLEVSRNFFPLSPSISSDPLTLLLQPSVILHSPDTTGCFLSFIV